MWLLGSFAATSWCRGWGVRFGWLRVFCAMENFLPKQKGLFELTLKGDFFLFLAFCCSFPTFTGEQHIFDSIQELHIIQEYSIVDMHEYSTNICIYYATLPNHPKQQSVSTFCQVCLPMCSEDGTDVPGGQRKRIDKRQQLFAYPISKKTEISVMIHDSWPDLCWFTCVLCQKLWLCICIYIYTHKWITYIYIYVYGVLVPIVPYWL